MSRKSVNLEVAALKRLHEEKTCPLAMQIQSQMRPEFVWRVPLKQLFNPAKIYLRGGGWNRQHGDLRHSAFKTWIKHSPIALWRGETCTSCSQLFKMAGARQLLLGYRTLARLHACLLSHFSRRTLCDPKVCTLPGSSVHGILQAKILEWVAVSSSWWSSWPRDGTLSPKSQALVGELFTASASWPDWKNTNALFSLYNQWVHFPPSQKASEAIVLTCFSCCVLAC